VQSRANIKATLGAQKASTVLTADTTVDDNPEVVLARAKLDQARLDLERTVLRAPVDGVVARRQVQVGQRVQAAPACCRWCRCSRCTWMPTSRKAS
jgi:membrane fusion protein (multidrug efflux system)